jgi:hypothetical protein
MAQPLYEVFTRRFAGTAEPAGKQKRRKPGPTKEHEKAAEAAADLEQMEQLPSLPPADPAPAEDVAFADDVLFDGAGAAIPDFDSPQHLSPLRTSQRHGPPPLIKIEHDEHLSSRHVRIQLS